MYACMHVVFIVQMSAALTVHPAARQLHEAEWHDSTKLVPLCFIATIMMS
jgi:hypothetical protein